MYQNCRISTEVERLMYVRILHNNGRLVAFELQEFLYRL